MLLSLIIPVYNAEQTLERAVNSVLAQPFEDFEIVLVDDGSTDASGALCDRFAETDARIQVIHQANGGLSAARNAGIERATGDYLAFLDSDDALAPEILREFAVAVETEAIDGFIFNYARKTPAGTEVRHAFDGLVSDTETLVDALFSYNGISFFAWNKIFRRELFREVRYPVGKLYEDMNPSFELVRRARRVHVTQTVGLYYYDTADSITNSRFSPRQLDSVTERLRLNEKVKRYFPESRDRMAEYLLDGLLGTAEKVAALQDGRAFLAYDAMLRQTYRAHKSMIRAAKQIPWQKHAAWALYTHAPNTYRRLFHWYTKQTHHTKAGDEA